MPLIDDSAWSRARQGVKDEISEAARRLFLARGFDTVTVEEIAEHVGISRRSLFRYFGTKEDIVLGGLAQQGHVILRALEARPEGEEPWDALTAALLDVAELQQLTPESMYDDARLYLATPALRLGVLAKHQEWRDLFTPELTRRIDADDPSSAVRASAIAAGVLACLHIATETWVSRGGEGDLVQFYGEAAAAIRGR